MSGTELKQRLAAILAADVAGYSRLMAADERATVSALDAARKVFRSQIESNQGRVIDMAGDSVLAVFETATGAVSAALATQQELLAAQGAEPEDRRMRFRIGVHLGDIIEKADGTVYGDGVNIAARLQALGNAGGITVSDSVRNAMKGKASTGFQDMGEQQLKNISEPIRAYAVRAHSANLQQSVACVFPPRKESLPKPPRLSIVVMPFANVSGEPGQDYFSDGITDEVTTQLSKIKGSYVIGQGTAFSYKGKTVDIKALGAELGVRYVLRGSVERFDEGVDTDVQLIDALTGAVVWGDSVEVDKAGIRNIRREVVNRLAIALNLQLITAEAKRSKTENPDNPDATDLVMQGWAAFGSGSTLAHGIAAQALFERALALQPDHQPALVGRSNAMFSQAFGFAPANCNDLIEKAEADAVRAIALDPLDALAHYALSRVRLMQKRGESAMAECDNALELDSNLVGAHAWRGFIFYCNGEPELAHPEIEKALNQSPRDPRRTVWRFWNGLAYHLQDRLIDAVAWLERSSYFGALPVLAASYFLMGDMAKANMAKNQLLATNPNFKVSAWGRAVAFSDKPGYVSSLTRVLDCLTKLGAPE